MTFAASIKHFLRTGLLKMTIHLGFYHFLVTLQHFLTVENLKFYNAFSRFTLLKQQTNKYSGDHFSWKARRVRLTFQYLLPEGLNISNTPEFAGTIKSSRSVSARRCLLFHREILWRVCQILLEGRMWTVGRRRLPTFGIDSKEYSLKYSRNLRSSVNNF